MSTFYLKQGDRAPKIQTTLLNPDDTAYDLSSTTSVAVRIKKPHIETPIVDGNSATIVTAASGEIEYQFADGETDIPGFFLVEWIVDEGLITEETFPNYGYDGLYIEKDL